MTTKPKQKTKTNRNRTRNKNKNMNMKRARIRTRKTTALRSRKLMTTGALNPGFGKVKNLFFFTTLAGVLHNILLL